MSCFEAFTMRISRWNLRPEQQIVFAINAGQQRKRANPMKRKSKQHVKTGRSATTGAVRSKDDDNEVEKNSSTTSSTARRSPLNPSM